MERITQTRLNALVAKYVYRQKLAVVRGFEIGVTIATVIVPILFIAAQYVAKGTQAEINMNLIAFIGSAVLICLAVLSLVFGISKKLELYSNGLAENIRIAEECSSVISTNDSPKDLDWFYKYVASRDAKDSDLLASVRETTRQYAYRKGLMELTPSSITNCPVCGASPAKFRKGDCQVCGNSK